MIKRVLSNKSGYTLPELVTSITLIGVLLTAVVAFGVNSLANYNISYARGELLDQSHLGLRNVSESILQAASADNTNRIEDSNSPGGGGELFGWHSDSDTLVLATAVEDNNNNIVFQDVSQYISYKNNVIYYLDNGSLKRRVLAADIPNNKARTTCPESAATSECPKDTTIIENVKNFTVKYFDSQNQEVTPENARSIGLEVNL
ncbi:MAG TPA: prepilin-type N-terminal cleavage/methylation domain-containing protein, partial [Patescibacteria group bacterium]|nr:prepilin-type N-terminal cleavage/methylation domain-containing protein [Patescibacteria group bacterium]